MNKCEVCGLFCKKIIVKKKNKHYKIMFCDACKFAILFFPGGPICFTPVTEQQIMEITSAKVVKDWEEQWKEIIAGFKELQRLQLKLADMGFPNVVEH
jgi:MinD superfamily P-loop ATPase